MAEVTYTWEAYAWVRTIALLIFVGLAIWRGLGRRRGFGRRKSYSGSQGHSEEYDRVLGSRRWRRLCAKVDKLWDYRCATCNASGPLQHHHRTYKVLGHEGIYDVLPLCDRCHEAVTPMEHAEAYRGHRQAPVVSF
jgi:hypothetical protein